MTGLSRQAVHALGHAKPVAYHSGGACAALYNAHLSRSACSSAAASSPSTRGVPPADEVRRQTLVTSGRRTVSASAEEYRCESRNTTVLP